jgi:hypothetical protein
MDVSSHNFITVKVITMICALCDMSLTELLLICAANNDDPLSSIMPPDDGQNHYTPNAVKIKLVEDV